MWWGVMPPVAGVLLIVILAWSLVWKGFALWRAATRGDKVWFIIFLIVNTAGILEIIYLFLVTKAKTSHLGIDSKTPDDKKEI